MEEIVAGEVRQDEEIQWLSDEIAERGTRETISSTESASGGFGVDNLEITPLFKEGLNKSKGI